MIQGKQYEIGSMSQLEAGRQVPVSRIGQKPSIDMEEVECSLRARLSAPRSSVSPLRFLVSREDPPELWADFTRVQESNEISAILLVTLEMTLR